MCCSRYAYTHSIIANPASMFEPYHTMENEQKYLIKNVFQHPDYEYYDYGFCLMETMEEIEFNENVQPACLPQSCSDECPDHSDVLIAGWGLNDYEAHTSSETLQKAKVPIVPRATCSDLYAGIKTINDYTTCAGYVGNRGIVPCYGDEGGGVMCYRNGYFQLDAILGDVRYCRDSELPSLHSRVCMVLDWIESIIG